MEPPKDLQMPDKRLKFDSRRYSNFMVAGDLRRMLDIAFLYARIELESK